jgi:broad specificity phosphatase PhoE
MAQLVVVRHGQASLFAAGDHPHGPPGLNYDELSPRGIEQAKRVGDWLRATGARFDAAYTGPARRQRDTLRWAGGDAPPWPEPVLVPELDEHDAFRMIAQVVPKLQADPEIAELAARIAQPPGSRSGAFQLLFEAVMKRWLRDELELDGLESWPTFRARVQRALAVVLESAGKGEKRIAFTSVGPIAVLLQHALGLTDLRAFETAWRVRNASVTTFVVRGNEVTLDAFNALPHLPDPSDWTFR